MKPTSRTRLALTSSLAAIGLMAGGCANQTTSYRIQRIGDSPMVITTDAYQRHLVMTPDAERTGMWRTCAEAAPDVFSAMSGSGGGDLGFNSTSGTGTEAQARAAMAIAQSAATAERTQTINLLRESMFRTCERYMNGAIDQATLIVQAGRDWRAMIAILAIEQLTQTGRPASTVISGPATSATVLGGEDARRELEEARERLTTAQGRLREAEALPCEAGADGTENGDGGNRDDDAPDDAAADNADDDAVDDSAAANDEDDGGTDDGTSEEGDAGTNSSGGENAQTPSTDDAANTAACATRQQRVDAANSEVQEAQADVDEAQEKLNRAARSSAATSAGHMNAVSSGRSLTPAALRIIAPVVAGIVKQAFDTDETQLSCLQIMSRPYQAQGVDREIPGRSGTVRQMCLQYLAARVQSDIETLRGYQVSTAARVGREAQMRAVEDFLARDPGTAGERWNQLVAPLQSRFPFTPLAVPADASMDVIREKMRIIGSALGDLVALIN